MPTTVSVPAFNAEDPDFCGMPEEVLASFRDFIFKAATIACYLSAKDGAESDSAGLFISLMRVFFDFDLVYSQCVLKPQRLEVTPEAMKAMLELHEAPEFKHDLLGSIIVGTSIMLIV
uniref:Uncharacterized protein n=1 Tax=Trichuris muris TaxID=70415 RepID=A0A5S6R5N2_TRIMR